MTGKHRLAIVAIVFVFAVLAVVGCGKNSATTGQSPAGKRIKIGFLVKQPEELWFQNEWKFAQKAADQYGFDLVKIGGTDGEKVLSSIDNLAAQGAQGFVICTPDVHLGPAIMAKAKANNMKVFTVDDQFLGADGKPIDVPYMGISARNIGEQVGTALYEQFKARGWSIDDTAACAITFDELPTARDRTDGATAALVAAGFPAAKIYRGEEKTATIPAANDAANIILTQHPKVKHWLVFSMNDEGVLGAVRAMEGMGFDSKTMCGIGIGGSTCLVEFEKKEPTGFYATALISPKRHGFETAEYLYKWVKDEAAPPMDTRTKGIIITRETYKTVMKEQGLAD